MLGPQIQRSPFFAIVSRAIVNTGNAALVTRGVINNSLDDVRLHTQLGQCE